MRRTAEGCCWTGCAPITAASPKWSVARPTKYGTHGPTRLVHPHVRSARGTVPVERRGTLHE
eukprot:2382771-Pleurochrysis_carterae.AAC.1